MPATDDGRGLDHAWSGVLGVPLYVAYRFADRRETARGTSRTHPVAKVADTISGRH